MADIFPFTPTGDVKETDKSVVTIIGTATQRRILLNRAQPQSTFTLAFQQITAQERADLLSYFMQKKGKWAPFWLRSYHPDFILTEKGLAGTAELFVKITNLDVAVHLKPLYLYVPSINWAARVVAIDAGRTDVDTGEVVSTKLTLSNTIPEDITFSPTTACKLERLYYVRFGNDTLSFKHKKMVLSECSITFNELSAETPAQIVHP